MLIMNSVDTIVADCIAIYITRDKGEIWIKGLLSNNRELCLGKYESIEAAKKVLNGFICKHA